MYKKFDELFIDETKYGTKIKTDQYLSEGKYPIVDQGQKKISGYTDIEDGIFKEVPAIIFGDHTRLIKYIDVPFFIGADGVKIIRSRLKEINYKYLYYALLNVSIPNTGYNRHFKWLKETKIYYPDSEKQKYIVEVLDKISLIIEKKNKQIEQWDFLLKSLFIEMFGDLKSNSKKWIKKTFTDIASIDTNMINVFDNYENYPHIGIESIEKGTGEIIGYRTVKEDKVVSGKYLFTEQHIIYSKIRPNLNKVALPKCKGVCSADAYPILVKNDECHRVFLAYTMRSKIFLDYIIKLSNRTNLPKVNKKQVEGFICPVPPLDLQNRFAEYVLSIDKSKLAVKKSLEELEILKKSLMQKYFA